MAIGRGRGCTLLLPSGARMLALARVGRPSAEDAAAEAAAGAEAAAVLVRLEQALSSQPGALVAHGADVRRWRCAVVLAATKPQAAVHPLQLARWLRQLEAWVSAEAFMARGVGFLRGERGAWHKATLGGDGGGGGGGGAACAPSARALLEAAMRLDAVLRAGLLLSSQPLWGGDGGELAAAADGEAGAAAGLPVVRRDEIASALETLDGGGSADGADLPREASSDVAAAGGASCAHGTALGAVEGAAQLGRLAAAFQTWNDRPRGRPGQPHCMHDAGSLALPAFGVAGSSKSYFSALQRCAAAFTAPRGTASPASLAAHEELWHDRWLAHAATKQLFHRPETETEAGPETSREDE